MLFSKDLIVYICLFYYKILSVLRFIRSILYTGFILTPGNFSNLSFLVQRRVIILFFVYSCDVLDIL